MARTLAKWKEEGDANVSYGLFKVGVVELEYRCFRGCIGFFFLVFASVNINQAFLWYIIFN